MGIAERLFFVLTFLGNVALPMATWVEKLGKVKKEKGKNRTLVILAIRKRTIDAGWRVVLGSRVLY